MFFKIFVGGLGILLAFLLLKFRYQIQDVFGGWSWAERYLGSTELGIFVVSVLIFIASLLYMTGKLNGMITGIFSSIF